MNFDFVFNPKSGSGEIIFRFFYFHISEPLSTLWLEAIKHIKGVFLFTYKIIHWKDQLAEKYGVSYKINIKILQ